MRRDRLLVGDRQDEHAWQMEDIEIDRTYTDILNQLSRVELREEQASVVRPSVNDLPQQDFFRRPRSPASRSGRTPNHVRFNNIVHVSPTPPGSDASSSAFRSYHDLRCYSRSRQVDGPQDDEGRGRACARDTIARLRTFARAARASLELHIEGGTPTGSELRQQPRNHAWVRGGRPLERALSESPSREDLRLEYCKTERTIDARGPYRNLEEMTDSMVARDGSRERQDARWVD